MALMVSGCNEGGGLFVVRDDVQTLFGDINCRGICLYDKSILAAVHDTIYSISMWNVDTFFKLPRTPHDIRVVGNKLAVMDTPMFQLMWIDLEDRSVSTRALTPGKHHNCLISWDSFLIRCESVKRPDQHSRIICETIDGEQLWARDFFDASELHSLVVNNNRLYWCASNLNVVRSALLSTGGLSDVRDELINNHGYVRGLCVGKEMIVGTSGNRRPDKCKVACNTMSGVVHRGEKMIMPPCIEIYEILDIGNILDPISII